MNDLKTFAALQARLYEFLAGQNEATLQAIVRGQARLAVLHAADAEASTSGPVPVDHSLTASRDPFRVIQELSTLASEEERRIYLSATRLLKPELQKVAKLYGLSRYSKLSINKLVDRLVSHDLGKTEAATDRQRTLPPSPSDPVEGKSATEQQPAAHEALTETGKPNAEAAATALRLRETETEEEGAAYLSTLHLDRESLLAVATELQLTRVDRLNQKELEKRVLKQAIGSRRKFSGLRKW